IGSGLFDYKNLQVISKRRLLKMLNKKTVESLQGLAGKKVLVRCDFNVPLKEGVIQNENRIVGALPTIKKLMEQGAKVILCSHLGKPKGEAKPELSLAPVAESLSKHLGVAVKFADDNEVVGAATKAMAADLKDGEVMLLQNTRYRGEETKYGKDEAAAEYAKELAALCDNEVFVNDAFGTAHRAHCSNVGVTKFTKENAVGYLMEKEIKFLGDSVENPVRPFVAIL
ncbi:MAG: phosphoglycerate kinase, partial [Clostridia bacterium]|nr:phosphoglycerate kinase [Clostridia bacterium]